MTNDTSGFLALLDNASSGALERGLDLADRGLVSLGSVSDGVVQARVQGTVLYRVALTSGDNGSWSCDCPAAADGSVCKHGVAVVAALEAQDSRATALVSSVGGRGTR